MENPGQAEREADVQQKAMRAQRILYILMCVLMVLPFLVVWLMGAFRL
jgi:heme/copper-type cytochrome/quinol oxidase subunit 4